MDAQEWEKLSGQTTEPGRRAAIDWFGQNIGRAPTDIELGWLDSRGDKGKVTDLQAFQYYGAGLKQMSAKVLGDAQAVYRIKDFNQADADKLVTDLVSRNLDKSNFDDRYNAALANIKVDRLSNPRVSTEQQGQNEMTVKEIFQSTLGRDPSKYELTSFAKQIALGDDPLILQQTLQQSGEYLDQKATKFRDKQAEQLQGFQSQAFERAAPTIISQFMRAGRLNSSGLQSALASAQQELTQQNNQYLAGMSREDFLNSQGQAQNIFAQNTLPSVERARNLTGMRYQMPFQLGQSVLQRGNELSDYDRSKSDFDRYMQAQKDQSRKAGQMQLWGAGINGLLNGAATYAARRP